MGIRDWFRGNPSSRGGSAVYFEPKHVEMPPPPAPAGLPEVGELSYNPTTIAQPKETGLNADVGLDEMLMKAEEGATDYSVSRSSESLEDVYDRNLHYMVPAIPVVKRRKDLLFRATFIFESEMWARGFEKDLRELRTHSPNGFDESSQLNSLSVVDFERVRGQHCRHRAEMLRPLIEELTLHPEEVSVEVLELLNQKLAQLERVS